jgi:transcriptional regulator with XRE-family HTH domain
VPGEGVRGFRPAALRRHRRCANLTQEQLALLIGAHRSQVAAWESGAVPPRAATLRRLAEALHITPAELLTTRPRPSLRDLRHRAGLSQRGCADAIDRSQPSYGALEAGEVILRDDVAAALAELLGVDDDDVRAGWTVARNSRPRHR